MERRQKPFLIDERARVVMIITGFSAPPWRRVVVDLTTSYEELSKAGVPASGVGAVVLNVTVTEPSTAGHLTVFPTGVPIPGTSNLNFTPGQSVPNLVIAPVGADGKISVFNSAGNSHVIYDVMGWLPG